MCLFNLLFSSLSQLWYVEVRISRSVSMSPLEFEITRVDCISSFFTEFSARHMIMAVYYRIVVSRFNWKRRHHLWRSIYFPVHKSSFEKGSTLKKKIFLFREDPFSERRKNSFDRIAPPPPRPPSTSPWKSIHSVITLAYKTFYKTSMLIWANRPEQTV